MKLAIAQFFIEENPFNQFEWNICWSHNFCFVNEVPQIHCITAHYQFASWMPKSTQKCWRTACSRNFKSDFQKATAWCCKIEPREILQKMKFKFLIGWVAIPTWIQLRPYGPLLKSFFGMHQWQTCVIMRRSWWQWGRGYTHYFYAVYLINCDPRYIL